MAELSCRDNNFNVIQRTTNNGGPLGPELTGNTSLLLIPAQAARLLFIEYLFYFPVNSLLLKLIQHFFTIFSA